MHPRTVVYLGHDGKLLLVDEKVMVLKIALWAGTQASYASISTPEELKSWDSMDSRS